MNWKFHEAGSKNGYLCRNDFFGIYKPIALANNIKGASEFRQFNMAPKITVKKEYILVEPKEVSFWQIWEGIGKVRNLSEFFYKNDIWVFRESPITLTYVDLHKLKEYIEEIYPEDVTRNKTAIVVATGLQSAMATFFSEIAKDLPFEIKVFSDFEAAEDWVIHK